MAAKRHCDGMAPRRSSTSGVAETFGRALVHQGNAMWPSRRLAMCSRRRPSRLGELPYSSTRQMNVLYARTRLRKRPKSCSRIHGQGRTHPTVHRRPTRDHYVTVT